MAIEIAGRLKLGDGLAAEGAVRVGAVLAPMRSAS
jgi:hypothetical protein